MPDAKHPALEPSEPGAERHVEPIEDRLAQPVRVLSLRHHDGGERVAVFPRIRADQLESVAQADPALVTEPQSAESVYEVWEVRRAVAELPPEEQEIVRLQHFEGLTHVQIAERLKLAAGTVKSRSFRAHKRLAAQLGHLQE